MKLVFSLIKFTRPELDNLPENFLPNLKGTGLSEIITDHILTRGKKKGLEEMTDRRRTPVFRSRVRYLEIGKVIERKDRQRGHLKSKRIGWGVDTLVKKQIFSF